ncbi:hypothetical protein [Homoserinimonas sp. OAct 916]|uniref:hypothetical protein n=1 Tax=Homoserinimonas sp. OAct 916 TaxID=2211450 RepID=UPI000DBE8436|nr:hypothetical protein [Homoserinimonas sp. OAct 916]
MIQIAAMRRIGVAVSLVLAAVLSIVWVVLRPVADGSPAGQLAAIADAPGLATASTAAFVLAQLPFLLAALGIAHFIADRAPVLATIGASLAVLGGFGHAVFGGVQLVQVGMAADTANVEVYAGLLAGALPWPLMVMMLAGTVGTALGLLFFGIGLMRAKAGPRWVPYTLWGFILVEFVGTGLTSWASLASGLLYLASFAALAVAVWRSPLALWMSGTAVARIEATRTHGRKSVPDRV